MKVNAKCQVDIIPTLSFPLKGWFVVLVLLLMGRDTVLAVAPYPSWVDQYDVVWDSQSTNSSGSMPVVGGNLGCNVWVENDEILFYFSSPGARDENGSLMKFGRMRIRFEPDIFDQAEFRQVLKLSEGAVTIEAVSKKLGKTKVKLWVEIHRPIVHTDIESEANVVVKATYENWRTEALFLPYSFSGHKQRGISYGNYPAYDGDVYIYPDEFEPSDTSMVFYHRMREDKCFFPMQIAQQGLTEIKEQLWDPLTNLTFGGVFTGDHLRFVKITDDQYGQTRYKGWQYQTTEPAKRFKLKVFTHINQTKTPEEWKQQLETIVAKAGNDEALWRKNLQWWGQFWNRSHIVINPDKGKDDEGWKIARNYNIFRYMLVSGFYGKEPSMFNGGVLTFDPEYENKSQVGGYTPDYRRWGAALTAQNQRLLYWPMLKSGDFDGILPQFDYYKNTLATTQGKVKFLWGHDGCMCVEQPTITGLLGMAEYGFTDDKLKETFRYRPAGFEVGSSNNRHIGRLYGSQLENAWMILEYYTFSGNDIADYLHFIEQAVIFYDEHFRMREKWRSEKELDDQGKLVIYPTNTLERHPYSKNPTSVIAGLTVVLRGLIDLPDALESKDKKERWQRMLSILPDYPIGEKDGHKYLKPAANWERNHDSHSPEMYPLYPYQLFGLGLDNLDLIKNTLLIATPKVYIERSGGWNQNVIHCARLGLTETAKKLIIDKIEDGPFRFPAFFPGGDYGPDHNVGGSGMIGLQEMLMQTHGGKIRLFPAWPQEWDVDFKLHAPGRTIVEVTRQQGKTVTIKTSPRVDPSNIIECR